MDLPALALEGVETRKLISQIRERVQAGFIAAFEDSDCLDARSIQESVIKQLTEERREIILNLLGLRNSFGTLEVDSRSNVSSIARDFIRDHSRKAIDTWMREHLKDKLETALKKYLGNPKVVHALQKSYIDAFQYEIRNTVSQAAVADARALAKQIRDQIVSELSLTPKG